MKTNLTIKEALKMAEITGQQVTITLRSGKRFYGCIVEKLWSTSFRIWINPPRPIHHGPGGMSSTDIVQNTATVQDTTTVQGSGFWPRPDNDIEKAIVAIHAVESVAFDDEIETDCNVHIRCNSDLQGIREALCIALLTRQTVEIIINEKGHTEKIVGRVVDVDSEKCCIRLSGSGRTKIVPLVKVECVIFS